MKRQRILTDTESFELDKRVLHEEFKSKFWVWREQRGLRNGFTHIILGQQGDAKSTFVRSTTLEILETHPVYVYLSEEPSTVIQQQVKKYSKNRKVCENNLYVRSEIDDKPACKEDLISGISSDIINYKIKCLIFDNLTTSRLYDGARPEDQIWISHELKQVGIKFDIPIVLVCHTAGTWIPKKYEFPKPAHIRNNKSVANLAECFYAIRLLNLPGQEKPIKFNVIEVQKGRGITRDFYHYKFVYDKETMLFSEDTPLLESDIKLIYEGNLTADDSLRIKKFKRELEDKHSSLSKKVEAL